MSGVEFSEVARIAQNFFLPRGKRLAARSNLGRVLMRQEAAAGQDRSVETPGRIQTLGYHCAQDELTANENGTYTAEAICGSLGLPSFEQDPVCTRAAQALRLLLKPSFHPEICLTFADGKVSVVSARSMVWHQFEATPVLTDRAEASVPPDIFRELFIPAPPIDESGAVRGVLVDGIQSDLLVFHNGAVVLDTRNPQAGRQHSIIVGLAISTAWSCISNPYCRNALSDAAEYVGRKLPRECEPARKPTIWTTVLGAKGDCSELLEALRTMRGA